MGIEQRCVTNTKQLRCALWKHVISLARLLKGGVQLSTTHGQCAVGHARLIAALMSCSLLQK